MKQLLTSNGLSNDSIAKAFQELIGKEPKDSKVAFIPTAANPERGDKGWLIDDMHRIKDRGYVVDVVELTALKPEVIKNVLVEADAIFVGGGNTFYLSYWMQKSGVFDLLPELLRTKVYAGISAGSIVAGMQIVPSKALDNIQEFRDDDYYEKAVRDEASAESLKLANLVFRSHLNSDFFPRVRKEFLEQIVDKLPAPLYALDDNSALKIVDGNIEVVTEGEWLKLDPANDRQDRRK
jgi:dipeptidase E